jgi:hypothetical protein
MTIELACDHEEAEQFAAWLRQQGHTVTIGASTGNYIDRHGTGTSQELSDKFNNLWDAYCAS